MAKKRGRKRDSKGRFLKRASVKSPRRRAHTAAAAEAPKRKRKGTRRRKARAKDWPDSHRRHVAAGKKGARRRKARVAARRRKRGAREDWKGQPIRHARAARKGHRRRKRRLAAQRTAARRRRRKARDWPGQPIRHARAARKGWGRRRRRVPGYKAPRRRRGYKLTAARKAHLKRLAAANRRRRRSGGGKKRSTKMTRRSAPRRAAPKRRKSHKRHYTVVTPPSHQLAAESRRRRYRRRGAAMENPFDGRMEAFGNVFSMLAGFFVADVVDRFASTHALTAKGTTDASGNPLYADNPPTSGSYTGLFNPTAICAPLWGSPKRMLIDAAVVAAPFVAALTKVSPKAKTSLVIAGYGALARVGGKAIIDLFAMLTMKNPIGQQLYDGEMRAGVLAANNGNGQANQLASLPSAGLGKPTGAGKPDCAPCAEKAGAGYPSMPREVAPNVTTSATAPVPPPPPPPPASPAAQLQPPPMVVTPPPPPPPMASSQLTGAPKTPKFNPFTWGDPNS